MRDRKKEKYDKIFVKLFDPLKYETNISSFSERELKIAYRILKNMYCNSKGYWKLKDFLQHCVIDDNHYLGLHLVFMMRKFIDKYEDSGLKIEKGFLSFKDRFCRYLSKDIVKYVGLNKIENDLKASDDINNKDLKLGLMELSPISVKSNVDIKDFLLDIKVLKNKYLKTTDDELINLIHANIYSGISLKTLRKYYYDS